MFDSTRRTFIQQTAAGLAALGVSGLVLRSDAQPTQEVNRDKSDRVLIQMAADKTGPRLGEGRTEESYSTTVWTVLPARRTVPRQAEFAGRTGHNVYSFGTRVGLRYEAPAAGSSARLLARRHAGEVFKRHD